jgi:predicted secreted hydrolase
VEWWYFNGHLTDDRGGEYSYHFVTFQTSLSGRLAPQLLQVSWNDQTQRLHLTSETVAFQPLAATPGRFDFQASTWRMRGDGASYELAFAVDGYSVELRATAPKPPALHQGTGLVVLGRAGESYYYSRTRLATAGILTIDGARRPVTGIAWQDHQWGSFSTQPIGWDWLSLQLNDESEVMVSLVWDIAGRQPIARYGTYVATDGEVRHLEGSDITLTPLGAWTSPNTGVVYPMGWRLEVASLPLAVTLTPRQQEAEFVGRRYWPVAYWEGAVTVAGEKAGVAVSGRGFAELVGYGSRGPGRP